MLNNETAEKLRYMKLYGMAEAFRSHSEDPSMQTLSFEERFGLLVDSEYVKRASATADCRRILQDTERLSGGHRVPR